MKLKTLVSYLEKLYPKEYAMDWDNVGLQLGDLSREVRSVLLALDIKQTVVDQAIENDCNIIITHHPMFFTPIKSIKINSPSGLVLESLIKHDISVYSMHTNLDVAENGVSDILAERYNIQNLKVLKRTGIKKLYKFIVYVPANDFPDFREKFLDLNVGNIGLYSHCSFSSSGEGTFKPLNGSDPYIGEMNKLERVQEYKIETLVGEDYISELINDVRKIHPYEEMAYDLIPLENKGGSIGLGRYGTVESIPLGEFHHIIPGVLKGNKDTDKTIKKVAVCGGNGSSLLKRVIDLDIDLFITSEIGYHDELLAEDYGLAIYDIGHENSEKVILPYLREIIAKQFNNNIEKVIVV